MQALAAQRGGTLYRASESDVEARLRRVTLPSASETRDAGDAQAGDEGHPLRHVYVGLIGITSQGSHAMVKMMQKSLALSPGSPSYESKTNHDKRSGSTHMHGNGSAESGPAPASTRTGRLMDNWVYGGALAGILLLCLAPVLTQGWATAAILVFLTLPAYMIHQYEEHDADRFRSFVNETMAGGRNAMTQPAVFVINIFGVWMPLAVCISLTRLDGVGYGAFAGWLLLINAFLHAVTAVRGKGYNPGLATAIAMFVPLGIAVLAAVWAQASTVQLAGGFILSLAIHAAIMIYMKRRIAQLPPPKPSFSRS